jgi:Recombination endonuclease VII
MLEEQNNKCKICSGSNPNGHRLGVDHDHKTGKVRGLLCYSCNIALERVEAVHGWGDLAVKYLQQTQGTKNELVD